jgi:hypothetical protein
MERRQKEKAIHERFTERMEAALNKLKASADNGRLKNTDEAYMRLGRVKEKYWRAASAFEVRITPVKNPAGKKRLDISWKLNPTFAIRG